MWQSSIVLCVQIKINICVYIYMRVYVMDISINTHIQQINCFLCIYIYSLFVCTVRFTCCVCIFVYYFSLFIDQIESEWIVLYLYVSILYVYKDAWKMLEMAFINCIVSFNFLSFLDFNLSSIVFPKRYSHKFYVTIF